MMRLYLIFVTPVCVIFLIKMTTNLRPGREISRLCAFGSFLHKVYYFVPVSCKRLQKFHTGTSSYRSELVPVSCKQIFLMVKEVFLLKHERNCYLWSVKWKSILRTFVGIVVSAKETKALLTNLHQVNIYSTIQKIVHSKTSPLSLTSQCNPNALLGPV